jgi:hypothetical protein
MVDGVGYILTFVILAALNLLALPLIPLVFNKPASKQVKAEDVE